MACRANVSTRAAANAAFDVFFPWHCIEYLSFIGIDLKNRFGLWYIPVPHFGSFTVKGFGD
jgi:hypothetical protein